MPTPPPWWKLTQVAPEAVLSSALRIGQSATASRAVEHLFCFAIGAGDGAGVEMIAADGDGRGDLLPCFTRSLIASPILARSP